MLFGLLSSGLWNSHVMRRITVAMLKIMFQPAIQMVTFSYHFCTVGVDSRLFSQPSVRGNRMGQVCDTCSPLYGGVNERKI
jgi:hypothetical protein